MSCFVLLSNYYYYISCMTSETHINSKMYQSPKYQGMGFFPICMISRKSFQELLHLENWRSIHDSFAGRSHRMVTKVNLIDKLRIDLGNYLLCKRLILHTNMEICCSFKSFAGGTCGFSYREDRSCISQVVPLHNCKKTFQVTRGVASFQIQKMKLILFFRLPVSSRH